MRVGGINCLRASSGRPDFPPPSPQVGCIYHIYRRLAAFITAVAMHLYHQCTYTPDLSVRETVGCSCGEEDKTNHSRPHTKASAWHTKAPHNLHTKAHQVTLEGADYCISLFCTSQWSTKTKAHHSTQNSLIG